MCAAKSALLAPVVTGRCAATDPHLWDVVRTPRPHVLRVETEPFGSAVGPALRQLFAAWPAVEVTHTRNSYVKLDVHSRLEALRVARAAGYRSR